MIIYNGQTELIERDSPMGDGLTELNLAADKAAELFKVNDWTWYMSGQVVAVPNSDDIVRQFISLMVDAVRDARESERGWGKVGGGRLYVSATRHDNDPDGVTRYAIGLGVEFSL